MPHENGRKPSLLREILALMLKEGYLTKDLVLGLQDLENGLKEGTFTSNAQTKGEAITRATRLMRGLSNPPQLAEDWVERKEELLTGNPKSEVSLRGRLLDEINCCLRKGGVITKSGIETDVPRAVKETIFTLNPGLAAEMAAETSREAVEQHVLKETGTAICRA